MSKFWPKRPSPEGFSIEKLAQAYRDKLASKQNPSKQQISCASTLSKDSVSKQNRGSCHWANRFYDEYRDAA